MKEYIDREYLKEKLYDAMDKYDEYDSCQGKIIQGYMEVDDIIDNMPAADVPEILYCKDCKNYCTYSFDQHICEEYGGYVKDNDFCSRGKKGEKKCIILQS